TRNVYVTAGTFDLSGRTETVYNFTNAGGTVLTGNGTLIVTASQTLDLLNGKTYVGGTVAANGLLVSGGDNQINAGGSITVNGTTNFTTSTTAVGMVLDSAASTPGKIAFA